MPFHTAAGPAVLVENICTVRETAKRLGVHRNSVRNWANDRDRTGFPAALLESGPHYDYAEVYEWFEQWVKEHPNRYPAAYQQVSA
jgi:transposase